MKYLSKSAAIIKLSLLQNSSAGNYFETHERLYVKNTLEELQKDSQTKLDDKMISKIEKLFQKYQKYI